MPRKQPKANESLLRAKRLFAANLVLFALLLAGAWVLTGTGGDSVAPQQEPAGKPGPEKPLSLSERAYLKGQMDALREHPETMPAFEETWVRHLCRKAILRDPTFEDRTGASVELLTEAYYRGYSERFDEYFDSSAARESGYEYGLRFDPALQRALNFESIEAALLKHKAELSDRFQLDAPKWRLFVEAFDHGFQAGYFRIKKGITADAQKSLRLEIDDFF